MKAISHVRKIVTGMILLGLLLPASVFAQGIVTPLDQDTLDTLTNEISGQLIFNNEVMLAGAPWLREQKEFIDTFYESGKIVELARGYGISTISLERHSSEGNFEYPREGEFWLVKPKKRLLARLGADAALVARGSQSVDVTGELVYIPPLNGDALKAFTEAGEQDQYKGKVALMWSHASGATAKALDAAGVQGVISFSSRDRYLDPNQVVYGSGSYGGNKNLKFGFSVSWRQWSELLEDVESGQKPEVNCKTLIEEHKDKYETVFAWIPGTEPDKKGVVFTAHLFEGYTKRGANDNMGGCAIQLEILRALSKLIANGTIPQPRRTIYFIWPNEIGGTYEFIKQNSELVDKWSCNINMDMCGEALRLNNSWFTMAECPNHLPSYLDGLAKSIMNYVWRTNDIVYLPDAPRGRRGGQYFPIPMMEKNGTTDAFRFFVHRATGGSDHICFNNASVAVPGIEFFTWPDQWYHADVDTPDKSDPTQMKRVAFIGAACAYAAANCTDEVLPGLIDATSAFGYQRIAEREHQTALQLIESATADNFSTEARKSSALLDLALGREIGALKSIEEIYSVSGEAKQLVGNRIRQWELYRDSLELQLAQYALLKAEQLKVEAPTRPELTDLEKKYDSIVPAYHDAVKGKEFNLTQYQKYQDYITENPKSLEEIKLSRAQTRAILNYVNGKRTITTIAKYVYAETGVDTPVELVAKYLEIMKAAEWISN